MIRSHDDLIRIEVIKDIGDIMPVAADFSIIDLPMDADKAKSLLLSIFNSPVSRHTTLLLNRHKRKDRIDATMNLIIAQNIGFEYLDTVTIWYERPSTCSNNGFLPVSEIGHLFYKGASPDVRTTAWFSDDKSNATNLWNISSQENEPKQVTYYQKFAWEIPLLLMSMSNPMENRRFVYKAELTESEHESLFKFCRQHNVSVQLYSDSDANALQMVRGYNADYGIKKK